MSTHPLTEFAKKLVEEHGLPRILDVEHSIAAYKPTLSGRRSPVSYYIRPPEGMKSQEFINLYEALTGSEEFRLRMSPFPGLEQYHQPILSVSDYAHRYFFGTTPLVRVEGQSRQAVEAIHAFLAGLKRPFDARTFPHFERFSLAGHQSRGEGRASQVKLLLDTGDHNELRRMEPDLLVHIAESNLHREIRLSRHWVRDQPAEFILSSTEEATTEGHRFLEDLAASLPGPSELRAIRALVPEPAAPKSFEAPRPSVFRAPDPAPTVNPLQIRKAAAREIAETIPRLPFGIDLAVKVGSDGTTVLIQFPKSLFGGKTFVKEKHLAQLVSIRETIKGSPGLHEGWDAHYQYDKGSRLLQLRVVEPDTKPAAPWEPIQRA